MRQKGFAPILIIFIALAGLIAAFFFGQNIEKNILNLSPTPIPTAEATFAPLPSLPTLKPVVKTTPQPSQVSMVGWKTYNDPANRFEFSYPPNLKFTDEQHSFCNANYTLPDKAVVITSGTYSPQENLPLSLEYSLGVSSDPSKAGDGCYIIDRDNSNATESIVYNGQTYYKGTSGGVGLGCHSNSDIYRTIYKNQCYEISLNWTEDGDWNDRRASEQADSERVKSFEILRQVLSTLKFNK